MIDILDVFLWCDTIDNLNVVLWYAVFDIQGVWI